MYSAGSRDKAWLCYRLGIVEAMYPGEKPVIIMDDPFTNFDTESMEGAMHILSELSSEYQIIYLTCHESRLPAAAGGAPPAPPAQHFAGEPSAQSAQQK